MFKQMAAQKSRVTLELKNDLRVQGTIADVDENLNIHLEDIKVIEAENSP